MGFGLGIGSIDRYFVFFSFLFFSCFQVLPVVMVGSRVGWGKLAGLGSGGDVRD